MTKYRLEFDMENEGVVRIYKRGWFPFFLPLCTRTRMNLGYAIDAALAVVIRDEGLT